jgi:hypothetical protein
MKLISFVSLSLLLANSADAAWLVKQVRPEAGKAAEIVDVQKVDRQVEGMQVLRSTPRFIAEHEQPSKEIYEEILYSEDAAPRNVRRFSHTEDVALTGASEVRTLVEQGPKQNRINLTMVGDGYTLAEKDRFFADAARLKEDLFGGRTFSSYLPLFNVYAVFVESRQSGVTDGSDRRDTALGLYRSPPGSKRGIMPGNPLAINAAIKLAPATDFSILIANDEYYGGLGGQYAITTRSTESGSVVLRHELGHNFGDVGEEYDNGGVYSGANSSRTASVGWKHWVDSPQTRVIESKLVSGEYVWQPLAGRPYVAKFDFPSPTPAGGYAFEVQLSTVGWQTPEDVHVYFDGQKVDLAGKFTYDRSFLSFVLPQSPAPGRHQLEVRENISDGDNMLAFAVIYAQPPGFNTTADEIGAFATFDSQGTKSYRPTHETCLMRDMTSVDFCPVDQENMWTRFLERVKLIDEATVSGTGTRTVSVKTPPLPGLELRWYRVDETTGQASELTGLQNQSSWMADAQTKGTYRVKASFRTKEVRKLTPAFDGQKDIKL